MSPVLRSYLDKHCTRHPAAVMPVSVLVHDFRNWLPASERGEWTRTRVINELLTCFTCGLRDRVWSVAGIAPRGEWRQVNGRLEMEAAHA